MFTYCIHVQFEGYIFFKGKLFSTVKHPKPLVTLKHQQRTMLTLASILLAGAGSLTWVIDPLTSLPPRIR